MLEENQDLVFNLIPDTEGKYECNRMGQVRNKNTKKITFFFYIYKRISED